MPDEPLPRLGAPVADTHAHLDMLEDPVGALVNAALAGVAFIATVVDVTEAPERTLGGLAGWIAEAEERLAAMRSRDSAWAAPLLPPEVRVVAGVHPHDASRWDEAVGARLAEVAKTDARVVAIGEAGLDFHYDHSPREAQREMFRAHLRLARGLGLPVILHLREAHSEGYGILAEEGVPEAGCVLHCFTDTPETARRFLDLGCLVSFAGPVTFPKAEAVREAAREVPMDRLLVETDTPFLAPEPKRGRRNEPAWCVLTAARLAEAKGVGTAELAAATYRNAMALFGGEVER